MSFACTGGNAVISLIFAEYLNRLFWHTTSADASPDSIPQWSIKLTAIAAVLIVSLICVATPTLGTRAAVVFTAVKVVHAGLFFVHLVDVFSQIIALVCLLVHQYVTCGTYSSVS